MASPARGTLERLSERVHRATDSCNAYVVTSGEKALLVDLGRGSALDALAGLGVAQVDWVLYTHHHRDQCQGNDRLRSLGARVAAPLHEARQFERAEQFWQDVQIFDRYDCSNIFSTSRQDVAIDLKLADYAEFEWEDITFHCLPTPGHTRGSLTYLATIDGIDYAFCGDLAAAGGRLWAIHDLHWSYDNPDALNCALHSVRSLRLKAPEVIAPSHGPVIRDAAACLDQLDANLRRFYAASGTRYQGDIDVPIAADPRFRRISEHLMGVTQTSAHFYVLRSDSGKALFFDYGFPSFDHVAGAGARFVEHSLADLASLFDIHSIDVVVPTHYHDDHVAGIPYLQRRFGCETWVFESFADLLARPSSYNLPAVWSEPIRVDRTIADGETIRWEEFEFEVRHCYSHTWYGAAFFGVVDGRRVGVIGDELQLDGEGRFRGGGPVFRNGLRPGSFTGSVRTIVDRRPELLLIGHDGPLEVTAADLDAAYSWCVELEASLDALALSPSELGFAVAPAWQRIEPYQAFAAPGSAIDLVVRVENFHDHAATLHVELMVPDGWTATRASDCELQPGQVVKVPFSLEVPADARPGRRHAVTADVVLGERDLGEVAECLVTVR